MEPAVVKQKPLQRCPTMHHTTTPGSKAAKEKEAKEGDPKGSSGTSSGQGTPKRKESVTWSPFGAIGKAVSSGVNMVGDATKAVGTGVVQGTKVYFKI